MLDPLAMSQNQGLEAAQNRPQSQDKMKGAARTVLLIGVNRADHHLRDTYILSPTPDSKIRRLDHPFSGLMYSGQPYPYWWLQQGPSSKDSLPNPSLPRGGRGACETVTQHFAAFRSAGGRRATRSIPWPPEYLSLTGGHRLGFESDGLWVRGCTNIAQAECHLGHIILTPARCTRA